MAQERPNRLAQWLVLFREQVPVVKERLEDWVLACKAEPYLIWETPAVRYATLGVGGLLVVWLISGVAGAIAPPIPDSARAQAETADFHVLCDRPDCGHHFVVNRKFRFSAFPVTCPKCNNESGRRALRCNSHECCGRWILPEGPPEDRRCPLCGEAIH
ncbi:MAG: hypothetical protein ACE5E5_03250 [Phycisphaerae bacterium]